MAKPPAMQAWAAPDCGMSGWPVGQAKEKGRDCFCRGFRPDQNSGKGNWGQSPAGANSFVEFTLVGVTPAKAGAQLPFLFTESKRDASLGWHDGGESEPSNSHHHWKRSDFKSGSDIG